jgi:hydroxyethylthiazole kinase
MKIPVVLDPVGMGASKLRNETVNELLKTIHFSAIKGNMSEMRSIYENARTSGGVDVEESDRITEASLKGAIALAKTLASRYKTVVIITGAVDIVTDGERVSTIKNGHPMMSKITGTGCMTGSLVATFGAVEPKDLYQAACAAVSLMGLAGEKAYALMKEGKEGTASMKRYMIDQMNYLDYQEWKAGARVENCK